MHRCIGRRYLSDDFFSSWVELKKMLYFIIIIIIIIIGK